MTITRIDIVLCATDDRICDLSARLCGQKLGSFQPLYTCKKAETLYENWFANRQDLHALSDTGIAVFGRYGLNWTQLGDLPADLVAQDFCLGWITRQQKAPINRQIDVDLARRNGLGGSVLAGGKKQRRAHDGRPPINDGKLRYSFVRAGSAFPSPRGKEWLHNLEQFLHATPVQHCHVWLNPDGSATVNAVFSREAVTPRQLTDLLFDEKGFTALTYPNPEHPKHRSPAKRSSMADQSRAKSNGS